MAFVVARNGDPALKRWHEQLSSRRGGLIAKTALSRKLLITAWAMMRDNTQYQDREQPDRENNSATALYRNKVRELEKRSQTDQRSVSMWKALQQLSTDKKLRDELGLARILPPDSIKHTKRAR
jgi:hypothetical protein